MLSLGSLKVPPARPVAFRPTLTDGLALSENKIHNLRFGSFRQAKSKNRSNK